MEKLIKIKDGEILIDANVRAKLISFKEQEAVVSLLEKQLKEELKEALESKQGVFNDDKITATIKKATTRQTLDTKKLKEELPDVYECYVKTSDVKSSISLSYDL